MTGFILYAMRLKQFGVLLLAVLLSIPTVSAAQIVFPARGGTGTSTIPLAGQVLVGQSNGTYGPMATSSLGIGGSGTVTSVALSAPTGFAISGSPITTSGTLTLAYAPGYGPVLVASSTDYQTFFATPSTRITAGANLAWSGNTLYAVIGTSTVRGMFSASSPLSYNSSTGAFSLSTAGDWTGTLDGEEGSHYLARANHTGTQVASTISDFASAARALFSSTAPGLAYSSGSGVFSLASGYVVPTTTRAALWDTAYSWGNHALQNYFDKDTDDFGDIAGTVDESQIDPDIARDSELHSPVTLAGTPDYITLSGQQITRGTIDIGDDTNLAVSTPITLTGDTVGIDTSGTWSGNASTATSLAANGSNCSSGNAPLGVNASGAAEGCFDVWTEAENTSAAYISGNQTITLSGDLTGSGATSIVATIANGAVDSYDLATSSAFADNDIVRWKADGTFVGITCAELTGSADLCDGNDASGSGGGSISTSTTPTPGHIPWWSSTSALGSVATGTLSVGTGLQTSATRSVIGGAVTISAASGYEIPLIASTTPWQSFYTTPSSRITAGDALTWSGNTLNFDGGSTPGGSLGGTWASPTIDDLFILNTGDVGTGSYTFPSLNSTNATTTTLNVGGQVDFDGLTSAIVLTGASGILAEYAGTSCTNQFVRSLSALGAATCATVQNTDLANSSVSYGGVSLSLGGSDATPAFALADATGLPIVGGTTSTLTVARGGTGSTTLSGILRGDGTNAVKTLLIGSGLTFDGTTLSATGGNGGSNWLTATTFGETVLTPTSTIPVWLKDTLYASSSLQFNTNLITEHPSLRFFDLQGRDNGDYTLMRIKAPKSGGHCSEEATLSLLNDMDGDNSGVNERFVDFYSECYDDSKQWGLRQAFSGTGRAEPFVLGHWDTAGSKDAGNKLIVLPSGAVAVARATSTVPAVPFFVASSTAATLARFDTAPGTPRFAFGSSGDLVITGSSNRQLTITPNTDGGDYNISGDTSGTLALFGSGPATLDVTLLDGVLTTGTLTLSGTGTLNGVDIIDATTEATIEAAMDTLPNVTTLGTITSGVWDGTDIAISAGGTGANTAAGAYNAIADMDATPDSDHSANGPHTNDHNAGASITVMDLVYLASDGEFAQADADAESTATGFLTISLETRTDGQAMNVALPGTYVRDDTWNWTPGQILYVSTTPGAITSTAPSGTDDVVRVIGYAVTADVIFFEPDGLWAVPN